MMMQKVRTNYKCAVNEDLFFPVIKYLDLHNFTTDKFVKYLPPRNCTPVKLTPFQQILKTEFLGPKNCMEYKCPRKNCKVKTNFHPLFIENGLGGCYACDKVDVIVRRILLSKGYELISIDVKGTKKLREIFLHT